MIAACTTFQPSITTGRARTRPPDMSAEKIRKVKNATGEKKVKNVMEVRKYMTAELKRKVTKI